MLLKIVRSLIVALLALFVSAIRPAPTPARLNDEAAQLDLAKAKLEIATRRDAPVRIYRPVLTAIVVEPPALPGPRRAALFAPYALADSLATLVVSSRSARGPPA